MFLGRVTGALFIHIYLKSNEKKTSTKVKSQFALKVDFIESKTLDIAWDLCDFLKLLVCHVNLIDKNLVNCRLQEQVHNCWKSLKLEKLTDETGWPGGDQELKNTLILLQLLSPLCASVELSYCCRKIFQRAPEITHF